MPLESGSRLGPYEVLSALGRGGMGEVWRAKDTKLDREVAIKTLPAEFASDPDRVARFEREAKVLASLNHPNIAAIHGFEQDGDVPFLVMEVVEGETVADRVLRGPMSPAEALKVALQIAEALEAAHEAGVVHRDLKPANVKITPEGRVKVLDFGLAKALGADAASDPSVTASPTLSLAATQQGVILGTAAYMAPEQARGKSADRRADVWAFGCVLFEMLTGRKAFRGEEVSDTLAAVLALEPAYDALAADLHPAIQELLRRCLAKDPRERWQAVGDLRLEIVRLREDPSGTRRAPMAEVGARARPWRAVAVAVAVTAILVGSGVWVLRPETPSSSPARFVMSGGSTEPLIVLANFPALAISPDGDTVAYRVEIPGENRRDIYIRRLDEASGRALGAVAEGSVILGAFSPDGEWLAYVDTSASELRIIPVVGGPSILVTRLGTVNVPGVTWGPGDVIVFSDLDSRALMQVSAGGGEPTPLTMPEAGLVHGWPQFLPDRNAIVFAIGAMGAEPSESEIVALDLDSGEQTTLIRGGTKPRVSSVGHLVYGAEGALRAVAFDRDRLEVSGTPAPVVEEVAATRPIGNYDYDISRNGTLVYASGGASDVATQRILVWVDRQGTEEDIGADPRGYEYLRISRDGRRVAVDEANQAGDIWVWTFASQNGIRLTTTEGSELYPVWSGDDRRIAFATEDLHTIFWKASSNTGAIAPLTPEVGVGVQRITAYFFTPDETAIVFRDQAVAGAGDNIGMIALDDENAEPVWLLASEFQERNAELSPDDRWMAYQSDESGRFEVYVRPFPDIEDDLFVISTAGGTKPLWGPGGDELFYLEPGNPTRMMVVAVETGETFTHELPEPLLDWPYDRGNEGRTFDIAPDGSRFLTTKALADETEEDEEPAVEPQVRIVLNWSEELKARVPVP